MPLKHIGLLAIFIGWYSLNAQDCDFVIQGVVTDFHDAQPLELAQIYVPQLQRTFTTNEKGAYRIEDLCPGVYELKVSHFDCDPKSLSLRVTSNLVQNIKLEHHIDELDQIQILADVHDDHESTQASTRIDQQTLNRYSGASLGDALATVHGVSSLKTGNSVVKPVIHGLYGSRVAIVNDGLRQQDQEWGVEHAPNIDINTASSIRVVKGASALRFGGDAVGGTILIEPKRVLAVDTLQAAVILQGNTNGRGGSIASSIENYQASGWYQQATLSYKRFGDFEAPNYVLSNTGSRTAALNITAGFKSFKQGASIKYSVYDTEIGILRASHIGNASDLVASINSGKPSLIRDFTYAIDAPKQAVQHHGLQIDGFKRFAGLGKLEVDYSLQWNNRKEFDIRRGENADRASLDIDLITHNLATYLSVDALNDMLLEVGLDASYQINQPNPDTGVRRLIPDYKSYKVGGFTSLTHNADNNWIFDAGLRYDFYRIDATKFYLQSRWEDLGYDQRYASFEIGEQGNQILTNPAFDYHLFAFTAGAKYLFSDHIDLSTNLSAAARAPNPSELYSDGLHHALATIELGSLDLVEERSYKLNTILHFNQNRLDVEINPHLNRVEDFIQLVPTGLETTTRGAFPVYSYQQVNAMLYGIDLSLNYDFWTGVKNVETSNTQTGSTVPLSRKLLGLSTNFSYIYGEDTTNNEALIDMPPAQIFTQLTWYDLWVSGLNFRLENQSVAKQTRFPDNDYQVSLTNDQGNIEVQTVNISETPAGYSLWNLGLDYYRPKYEIHLSVNNVLNTTYRNYLNRQRFYADDVGRDIQLQFIYNL